MPFVQFVLPLLLASGVQDRPSASASVGDWKVRLSSAIASAVSRNPELISMEARIPAPRTPECPRRTRCPIPRSSSGLKDVPVSNPSLSRSDFTMEMVTARQSFPGRASVPATREESARAAAANSHGRISRRRHAVALAAEVADAFFTLAGIDQRLEILSDPARLRLKGAASSATERYRVGKGTQSDVLRANLETTATEDRLLQLRPIRTSLPMPPDSTLFRTSPAEAPVPPIGEIEIEPPAKTRCRNRPGSRFEGVRVSPPGGRGSGERPACRGGS